jgi:Domain of unknown function (DUF6963)
MTIGIGAYGPRAGLAVYKALKAAECVGRGAIGGFATYAAISADGQLYRHETQRGGSGTLFIEGELTGVAPPEHVANTTAAAVISSGPERPAPLSQFLAADSKGGLVTGHRLPNGLSVAGAPLNLETLGHLIAGKSAKEAVDTVIGNNREADVGLIAVDRRGNAHSRNSERVKRRPDLGHARLEDKTAGAVVEVLHNAIRPFPATAVTAAAIALDTMIGEPQPIGWLTILAGVPLELGAESAVHCDEALVARRVVTTDPIIVKGHHACAGIYLHSRVFREGEFLGLTMFEPITTVVDGKIIELSGQKTLRMSFRTPI